jgi:hypothetical protein
MRTLSTRALAALAYERGQDRDPVAVLTAALLDDLSLAREARPLDAEPSAGERERLRRRRARAARRELHECDEFGPITGTPGLLTAPTEPWALDAQDLDGRPLTAWVPDGALL